MLAGKNPYRYKWQAGDPERWADPAESHAVQSNRVSVTPTTLAFYTLLSWLPYNPLRWIWWALQWILLGGIGLLLARAAPDILTRRAILILMALLAASPFWLLHVERGQVYVLFACATLAAILPQVKTPRKEWFLGMLLGVACFLRPPYILCLMPWALWPQKNKRRLRGFLWGVAAAVGLPMLLGGAQIWNWYTEAMCVMPVDFPKIYHSPTSFPETIEGLSHMNIAQMLPDVDSCLNGALMFYQYCYIEPVFLAQIFGGAMLAWAFIWIKLRLSKKEALESEQKKLAHAAQVQAIALVIVFEILLPIMRFPYCNIILALLIGLMLVPRGIAHLLRIAPSAFYLTAAGLLCGLGFWISAENPWRILFYLSTVLPLIAAFIFSVRLIQSKDAPNESW